MDFRRLLLCVSVPWTCFALKVAPLAFQKVMHHVLGGLEFEHVLIYLDDCLLLTSTLDKHLETLEKVFDCFKNAGLILQSDKCHFFLDSVNFWGFKSEQSIQPRYKGLTTIRDYPIPMIWESLLIHIKQNNTDSIFLAL